ncbi:MAG: bifunctional 4-hydroxy-3-methylbut-2-enyl diphosphate reductase/30S ribosomal protein S1 [Christensenellaceae bacterium]|nr:bifunctional 4-hydroxy-3-methylbut-2-enyl diphosphate reductase/30S ribosomal protein S1 [Christensenellaceae bacterium]
MTGLRKLWENSMPEIITAKYAGFCFGVKRAVTKVMEMAEAGEKLAVIGDLIHNRSVISRLEEKGVRKVGSPYEINKGETAVIRSHGEPPETFRYLEDHLIPYIDLTCPFVKRIHERIMHEDEADIVFIVGDEDHPEVKATRKWTGLKTMVIPSDEEDFSHLPEHIDRAVVLAQTTIKNSDFKRITDELRKRSGDLRIFNSICDATEKRQNEAAELSARADAVVVVGDRHSSNTVKLYEICKKNCKITQFVESKEELFLDKLRNCDIIMIIAGASAPEWIIREVRTQMSELENVQATEEEVKENMPETDEAVEKAETTEAIAEEAAPEETAQEEAAPAEAEEEAAPAVEAAEEEAAPEQSEEEANFAAELEKTFVRIRRGQFVKGTVVQVTESEICVNIGYKSDGILKLEDMQLEDGKSAEELFPVGSEIEAEIVSLNDGEGNVILSRRKIEGQLKWRKLADEMEEKKDEAVYECKITRVIKGGVLTKLDGYDAFIPASQLSLKYVEDLNEFMGQTLKVKVIDIDRRQKRFVLSHKEVLKDEADAAERALYNNYHKGDIVKGTVKRLTDFGAFVDIGGVDGLLHITDISWTRIKHPREVLSENQEIEVRIKNVDPDKKKVSLEYRQLQPKPWDLVPEKYHEGDEVEGKVVRIADFGAFVELEPSVDGLVHISQVTNRRIEKVSDVLQEGDVIKAKILEVNPEKKRISLSIRALMEPARKERAEGEARPERSDRPRRRSNDQNRRVERDAENNEFSYVMPTEFEEAKTSLADLFKQLDDEEK